MNVSDVAVIGSALFIAAALLIEVAEPDTEGGRPAKRPLWIYPLAFLIILALLAFAILTLNPQLRQPHSRPSLFR